MSILPTQCVLDASVGIKLFVKEQFSETATRLFDCLAEDPPGELHVPDLFYIECTNILWKYTRRFGRPLEHGLADLNDLKILALRVFPTSALMEDALSLATQTGLSAYDACYAVLAQRLNLPLVTADQHLANTISWAVWLGEYEIDEGFDHP